MPTADLDSSPNPATAFKRDIGARDGAVMAFGGPLSNLEALTALLEEAAKLSIPDDRLICTGDAVGYGADGEACLALLAERRIATVKGNVEEALGAEADDCGCNFVEGSTCDALAGQWYAYAAAHISAEKRAWMRALPRLIALSVDGLPIRVVHGGVRQINRYIFASSRSAITSELDILDESCAVIAGHAGIPFSRAAGRSLWHNAGSLGLPANDGTPRVWYSLIEPADEGLLFSHRPLDYDFAAAARKLRAAGLPEAYARALETGLWPDTAILPEREKLETGIALDPHSAVWGLPDYLSAEIK
jgi:hypothetical protein